MQTIIEEIAGDTAGVRWDIPVLRFSPRTGASGPSAYLQAALHANEQPGTGALHLLCAHLRRAEAAGNLLGPVTIVPTANPIGLSQYTAGQQMGRFDAGSRINFNRDFPLLPRPDTGLLTEAGPRSAPEALKARLLALAVPCDIVLDLHCDDEAVSYIYIHSALWPAAEDLAAALGSQAAILWDGPDGGAAFEEAALAPWLADSSQDARLTDRVVATVELRGRADVSGDFARHDADGLYGFLAGRGVVAEEPDATKPRFTGRATPIRQVEMVRAPAAGVIWYHCGPGDSVEAGDRLVTIVSQPGQEHGALEVRAPMAGYVLTRRAHRYVRTGEDLLKLMIDEVSPTYRPGTLEA